MSTDKTTPPPQPPSAPSGLFSSLSSSLGGRRTPRASSDTIAHPLLGASSSSSLMNESGSNEDSTAGRSPESVTSVMTPATPAGTSPSGSTTLPYKPRQRHHGAPSSPSGHAMPVASLPHTAPSPGMVAAPTTSTTSTTIALSPASDTAHLDATATSRLQLQSLKATAQRIGLGNGSMGMGMIDSIFDKGARARAEGGDWADLLKVLTSGKAIILLPSTPASSLPMTPQTLRDHVAFLSPPISVTSGTATPSDNAAVLVTLSGIVGTLRGTTVAFESTVPTDTPPISALRDDAQRGGVLARLRPTQPPEAVHSFPHYTVSSDSAPLAFPALGKAVPIAAADKPVKEAPRRINPFASLFGPSPSTTSSLSPAIGASRSISPEPASTNSSVLSSPRPSIASLEPIDATSSPDPTEGYTVVAYMINKPVRYNEVHKGLVKAVRSGVRTELKGVPEKVVDKTLKLVVSAVCPASAVNPADQALLNSHHHGLGTEVNAPVTLDFSDPTMTGERLQDFMEAVYDDLVSYYRNIESPRKSWPRSGSVEAANEEEDERRGGEHREQYVEQAASDDTEKVEGLVCRLLYNRIFSPLQSDDARHDEALASRIAALNMLDLSLDHLGLVTRPPGEKPRGTIANGLAKLCAELGVELQKLSAPDCLTPKEKADVLVQTHKLAVDGLAELPPIQLRPEGEEYTAPDEEMLTIEEEATPDEETAPESPTMTDSTDTVIATKQGATSGADLILPIIIYAVVKANPPQLASQLMYLRRYRSAICLAGEASYAIVNLTAVVEFLEHVQLSDLGLGDSDRVMSVEDLTPIGLPYLDDGTDAASIASASSRLRGRVFQVSELAGSAAGSANKVITGVVDSSWSALRGIISSTPQVTATPPPEEDHPASPVTRHGNRPRQSSTFSLASVTASVASIAAAASTAAARTRSRANSHASDWPNQEMVEVPPASRPESLRGLREHDIYEHESDSEAEDDDHGRPEDVPHIEGHRSIVPVSTVMSREASSSSRRRDSREPERERERSVTAGDSTIGGRLAQMGGFRLGTPPTESVLHQERPSLFASLRAPSRRNTTGTPSGAPRSPLADDGPIERFMTCEAGDLRMSEVVVLLRDYRRLAGVLGRLQTEREAR